MWGFRPGSALKLCLQSRRPGFDPWVGKTPCRRARPAPHSSIPALQWPAQHPTPEKPMDRGAWRATVLRAAQSRTRLKRLHRHTLSREGNEKLKSSRRHILPPQMRECHLPGSCKGCSELREAAASTMPALLGAPQLLALRQSHSIPRRGSCPRKESLSLLPCFCSLPSTTQPNKLLCFCPIQLLTGSEDCPQAPAHPETLPMACVMWCVLGPAGPAGVCLDTCPLPKRSTTEADVDRDLLSLLQGLLPALLRGG